MILEEEEVRKFLDETIRVWRERRKEVEAAKDFKGLEEARHYIDAYQYVRSSLLGSSLPMPENPED